MERTGKLRLADFLKIAAAILVCLFVGIIGSAFTKTSEGSWYAGLNRPAFSPPNWLFGPVWTTLYILMGISLYLVWSNKAKSESQKKAKKNAICIFFVQLILNTLWSILFFGLENPLFAFIEIIFLWAAIMLTIVRFEKISRWAAYLLVPYILWVSFASILNFAYVLLN